MMMLLATLSMKLFLLLEVVTTIVSTRILTTIYAQEFNVTLWGDLPYYGRSSNIFDRKDDYGLKYQALRNSINSKSHNIQFAIHTGDIKSGNTPCIDLYYDRFYQLSNSLSIPSLLTLGDNEWTDCYRASPLGYNNPLKQLQHIRTKYFNEVDDNGKSYSSMGGGNPIQLSSFGIDPFIENQYFEYNNIMFALLHVVGTNNNKWGTNCDRRMENVDPGCKAANNEFIARDVAVNQSLQKVFRIAKQRDIRGIMIAIQAHFWGGTTKQCNALKLSVTNATSTVSSGYKNFLQTLMNEIVQYSGSVVLVHGDAHFYRYCNPTIYSNVAVVMVPGSNNISWILSTIDSTRTNINEIFQFQYVQPPPVVPDAPVRSPINEQVPVVVPSSPSNNDSSDDEILCTVRYKMYNARTDDFVGQINYGKKFANPPCNLNIEVVVRCEASDNSNLQRITNEPIRITLRRVTKDDSNSEVLYARTEFDAPYFVFGNHRTSTNNDDGYRNDAAREISTSEQELLLMIDIRAVTNPELDQMLPSYGMQFRLGECTN